MREVTVSAIVRINRTPKGKIIQKSITVERVLILSCVYGGYNTDVLLLIDELQLFHNRASDFLSVAVDSAFVVLNEHRVDDALSR